MSHSLPTLAQCNSQLADIQAIDYYLAEQIVEELELDAEITECVFYCLITLSRYLRSGHSCLPLEQIAQRQVLQSSIHQGWASPALAVLSSALQQAEAAQSGLPLIKLEQQRLYLMRYWQFEQDIKQALCARNVANDIDEQAQQRVAQLWPALFPNHTDNQIDWQQVAVLACLRQQLTILCGGPGTGKTYTLSRMLVALQYASVQPLNLQLAAPTGKAANRMTEAVNQTLQTLCEQQGVQLSEQQRPKNALTLHRLLGTRPDKIATRFNQENQLACDVLIIDEASMVDVALMARVCRALPPHAKLILVGDPNQLPAVEAGNVMGDLVANSSPEFSRDLNSFIQTINPSLPELPISTNGANDSIVQLRASQRFSGQIAQLAQAIETGDRSACKALLQFNATSHGKNAGVEGLALVDFVRNVEACARHWFNDIVRASSTESALQLLHQRRWLTPVRRGPLGVEGLNQAIERALGIGVGRSDNQGHYHGRPIMVTENDYAQHLYNGDIGIVWTDNTGRLKAWFETGKGEMRSLSLARLPRVETVFAMTVHKSQGSEFDYLLQVLPDVTGQGENLCTRELLYTGVTRAKVGLAVAYSDDALTQALLERQRRFSGLYGYLTSV